jgi:hypothetical protein
MPGLPTRLAQRTSRRLDLESGQLSKSRTVGMTKISMTQRAAYSPATCAAGRIRLAHGLIKTIGSLRYRPAALDQPPILRRDGGRRRVRLRDVRRPRYPRGPHPRRVRPGQTYSRTDLGVPGSHNDVITTVTNKTVYVDVAC